MKRALLLIPLLLIALGLCRAGWRAWNQTSPPVVLLADGSWLVLRGATVGPKATYDYGTPWERLAARVPGKLGRQFGGNTVVNAGLIGPTKIVFWFERRGVPLQTNNATAVSLNSLGQVMQTGVLSKRGTLPPKVRVVPADGLRVNVRDEQGHGEPGYHRFVETVLPNGVVAVHWRADVVPTGSRRLKLCVYEFPGSPSVLFGGTGGKRIGEIFLPNPLYQKGP